MAAHCPRKITPALPLQELQAQDKKECMQKQVAVILLLLFGSLVARAANNNQEHTYDAPFDKVWTACVQAASEKYKVTHSERESGILSFENAAASFHTETDVSVSVVKVSDTQTKVIVHPQKKQAQLRSDAGSVAKTYLEAVDEKLK
jgi:hypothetical protein